MKNLFIFLFICFPFTIANASCLPELSKEKIENKKIGMMKIKVSNYEPIIKIPIIKVKKLPKCSDGYKRPIRFLYDHYRYSSNYHKVNNSLKKFTNKRMQHTSLFHTPKAHRFIDFNGERANSKRLRMLARYNDEYNKCRIKSKITKTLFVIFDESPRGDCDIIFDENLSWLFSDHVIPIGITYLDSSKSLSKNRKIFLNTALLLDNCRPKGTTLKDYLLSLPYFPSFKK